MDTRKLLKLIVIPSYSDYMVLFKMTKSEPTTINNLSVFVCDVNYLTSLK